jgi:hypothetical protein
VLTERGLDAEANGRSGAKAPQVLRKQINHLVPVALAEAGRMRRQYDIRRRPEAILGRQRLAMKDIE